MAISLVHIITTIDLGGAEKQLLALTTRQVQNGDKVEVIFLKSKPQLLDKFIAVGVKVNNQFHKLSFLQQVLLLMKRRREGDVVFHAHLPRAELLCALALKPRSFVVTRHNSEPFFPKAPARISRLLSRFVMAKAFASISISKAVTNYLKISRELQDCSHNFIIYYGLEDLLLRNETYIEHKSDVFKIGTASRLVPQKNLQLLLNALKVLSEIEPKKFHLSVAGTGPMFTDLKSQALELGLQDSISWLGQIQDMTKFYHSIDVFVLSSNYEGFGLVLLEAMAHGVPIVARGTSSIPEVLGESHPSIVKSSNPEELARGLSKIMNDYEYVERCLEYQSKQLEKFSIEGTQKAHSEIYNNLLQERAVRNA
jgi:glycosyltransferase involved in cell wall biosynthesis